MLFVQFTSSWVLTAVFQEITILNSNRKQLWPIEKEENKCERIEMASAVFFFYSCLAER